MRQLTVEKNDAGQRLDKFLLKKFKTMPKSMAYMYIRKKCIKLNGKRATGEMMLKENDILTFYIKEEFFDDIQKENYEFLKAPEKLSVIYEDENIILINKQPGVICHQDSNYHFDCLSLRLQHYLYKKGEYDPKKENTFTPALANRIDRNTGGIVIGAKNSEALRIINQKIRDREIHKFYLCLLTNEPKKKEMLFKDYLIKNEKTNKVKILRKPNDHTKEILTKYKVLETKNNLTLCQVELLTGRTHQIRAHMSSIGCPLLGDNKYGNKKLNEKYGLNRQCLFSYKLRFDFTSKSGILEYLNGKEFSVKDIWFMDYIK